MNNKLSSNAGLTMVELICAVSIFILILGTLTIALDKTTQVWSPKNNEQEERNAANNFFNFLEQDLNLAVADNGIFLNASSTNNIPPTFIALGNATNDTDDVRYLFKFIKHSSVTSTDQPPALDAVYYSYNAGAIFRRVIPLHYTDPENPEHIGTLLEKAESIEKANANHQKMIAFESKPFQKPEPDIDNGSFSLIATRADITSIRLPNEYNTQNKEYYELTELPGFILISARFYKDKDWNELNESYSGDEENYLQITRNLGFASSRMIQLKAANATKLQ